VGNSAAGEATRLVYTSPLPPVSALPCDARAWGGGPSYRDSSDDPAPGFSRVPMPMPILVLGSLSGACGRPWTSSAARDGDPTSNPDPVGDREDEDAEATRLATTESSQSSLLPRARDATVRGTRGSARSHCQAEECGFSCAACGEYASASGGWTLEPEGTVPYVDALPAGAPRSRCSDERPSPPLDFLVARHLVL